MLRFFLNPIRCLRELHAHYGSIATVSAGDPTLVCVFGPELNRQVLSDTQTFHNGEIPLRIPERSPLRLSACLVGMNGVAHQKMRRTLLPLFQKSNLGHHRDTIVAAAEEYLARWEPGQVIDNLWDVTSELALCVSFRCLFGLDITSTSRSLADMALGFINGATSPKSLLFPYEIPGVPYWHFAKLCDRLEAHLGGLVAERRKQKVKRHDALSVLVTATDDDGNTLPDSLVIGLVNEMFIAGHDTTARTLAWTLFLLDQHPAILSDLVDELATQTRGHPPTIEQIGRLPLLNGVVKESMRLLPAAPYLFFRRTTQDTQIGHHDLPAGAAVVVSPLVTHHMPELYSEPDRFNPARWQTGPQPSAYEYLPFGAGPRSCLGASFATLALQTVLALIVQRFRLSLIRETDVSYRVRGIGLGTRGGIPMRIEGSAGTSKMAPHRVRGTIRDLVYLP